MENNKNDEIAVLAFKVILEKFLSERKMVGSPNGMLDPASDANKKWIDQQIEKMAQLSYKCAIEMRKAKLEAFK